MFFYRDRPLMREIIYLVKRQVKFAGAISVLNQIMMHSYVYWIWLRGFASYVTNLKYQNDGLNVTSYQR